MVNPLNLSYIIVNLKYIEFLSILIYKTFFFYSVKTTLTGIISKIIFEEKELVFFFFGKT